MYNKHIKRVYRDNNNKEIEQLVLAVENRFNEKVISPSGFKRLRNEIEESCGVSISVSTLMRIWGYVKNKAVPNKSTLNVLSKYVGFNDYDMFCSSDVEISRHVMSKHVEVIKDLEERDHILLQWQPGRKCFVRYLGGGNFVVENREHSHLSVGDTFSCHLIIAGEPLFLSNVVHENSAPMIYVCGNNGGVDFIVYKKE